MLLQGCAFMNRDNTPALNLVEDNLWPEATGWRVVAFPVVFPIGLVAVITDGLIIHPVTVIDDAAGDTGDILWDEWDWDEHYVTECAALPWRAVATPLIFIGDFLGRWFFDVPTRASQIRAEKEQIEISDKARDAAGAALVQADRLLAEGKPSEALDKLLVIAGTPDFYLLAEDGDLELMSRIRLRVFEAARLTERYGDLNPFLLGFALADNPYDSDFAAMLQEMHGSEKSLERWIAFQFGMSVVKRDRDRAALIRRALADPERVIRFAALSAYSSVPRFRSIADLAAAVKKTAEEDPDPVIRAFAGHLNR